MAEKLFNPRRQVCHAHPVHRRATMRQDPIPPVAGHNCVPRTDINAKADCHGPHHRWSGVPYLLPAASSTRWRAYAPAKGGRLLYTMPPDPIRDIRQKAAKPDTQENPPPPQVAKSIKFESTTRWACTCYLD